MIRILMIPDAFEGPDSGAEAARMAARTLTSMGCEVAVHVHAVLDKHDGVNVFPRKPFRVIQHVYNGQQVREFQEVLAAFTPHCVFFLGSATSKPAGFFEACREHQTPTISMWWTQDFYCARYYACLPDGPCRRCLNGKVWNAFFNNCSPTVSGTSIPTLLGTSCARILLKPELIRGDVLMGSSESQLTLYRSMGVACDRIIKCPLFFDRNRIRIAKPSLGSYVVCYGQSRMEKGWQHLADIIHRCPNIQFVLPFHTRSTAEVAVQQFNLGQFGPDRCSIRYDINWKTGVADIVAAARAVLIPSIWPTTTEYTLLESLGMGKAVFTFRVGIHAEVIRDGVNGFTVEVGNTAALADRINTIADSDALANEINGPAQDLFYQLTNPDEYVSAFRAALSRVGLTGGARSNPLPGSPLLSLRPEMREGK